MPRLRTLTVDDRTFMWRMRWSYDRDGERIVHLTVLHAEGGRPRGKPLLARLVSREPEYPAETAVALPGDARAALDLARARGWDGTRVHWLLPAAGLERPGLVLSTPTRLREWAGDHPLYVAHYTDTALAAAVADELAASAVPEAAGGREAQWSGARGFVMCGRWGSSTSVYTRTVVDVAAALRAAHRHSPDAGASLRGQPAQVHGPGTGEIPAADVIPANHWASVPHATRYPGVRAPDAIWVIDDPAGARIEAYLHHADAPDRLWTWSTLRDGSAVERRFRR